MIRIISPFQVHYNGEHTNKLPLQLSSGPQPVECDGRVIKYTGSIRGETRSHVRLQSPTPSGSDTFFFEFDINSLGENNDISVGFFSNGENFLYHGKLELLLAASMAD